MSAVRPFRSVLAPNSNSFATNLQIFVCILSTLPLSACFNKKVIYVERALSFNAIKAGGNSMSSCFEVWVLTGSLCVPLCNSVKLFLVDKSCGQVRSREQYYVYNFQRRKVQSQNTFLPKYHQISITIFS